MSGNFLISCSEFPRLREAANAEEVKKCHLITKNMPPIMKKRTALKLNIEHDKAILDKLDSQENKQGYIKQLILKDINKQTKSRDNPGFLLF